MDGLFGALCFEFAIVSLPKRSSEIGLEKRLLRLKTQLKGEKTFDSRLRARGSALKV